MSRIIFDKDVDLGILKELRVGVLGYGNQGRAQALNMRDSGIEVIVGNRRDAYFRRAESDSFPAMTIRQAVSKADVLIIAIPDEIQEQIYERHIRPALRPGQVLDFASSYGIRFKCIVPPDDVDVVMMSPRAMGVTVRESFEAGNGVPGFVAVAQDATGRARDVALALAKAVGCTRVGVVECTFEQETDVNLFGEQALWPLLTEAFLLAFEVMTEHDIPPEIAVLEFYASGEASEILRQIALMGMFRQAPYHSPTSQYGTLTRAEALPRAEMKKRMTRVIRNIRNGSFAKEWAAEQASGYGRLNELKKKALKHPINRAELKVQALSASPMNFSTQ
jgi:ketol-acid reductoisomerase